MIAKKFASIIISVFTLASLIVSPAMAQTKPMGVFLDSCLLGIGVGALLGVASMAISEDPAAKTNQIARGASYGLYAGIGLGLYRVSIKPKDEEYSLFLVPQVSPAGVSGGSLLFLARLF